MRTILLLACNPRGTERLRLDEEVKRIDQVLNQSRTADEFKLVVKWAATDEELQDGLLANPEIVHFLGHGTGPGGTGSSRELGIAPDHPGGGLAFENEYGGVLTISGDSLARQFALSAEKVKCVVLNACHSASEAEAIAQHIDCVIGMNKAIGDAAAVKFSVGFYKAIVAGKPFDVAFDWGRVAIDLRGIPEHLTPTLYRRTRPDAQPTGVVSPPRPAREPAPKGGVERPPEGLIYGDAITAPRPCALAIEPSDLKRVQRALRKYYRPELADFIVQKMAKKARDLDDLCKLVAAELESADNRKEFLRSIQDPG